MLLLVAGFALSLMGSLPPGLISLTVSQTSITRGLAAALAVAMGAAVAEFFQACAAVLLTDWFLSHLEAEQYFRWAAVPVFMGLGAYLIFFAKAPKPPDQIEPSPWARQFAKGLVVSLFNLLAVPYWFVYCAWLRVEGWWQEGLFSTLIFSLGVSVGTIIALAVYAWLGQTIVRRSGKAALWANGIIGLILFGIGIKVLWGLVI